MSNQWSALPVELRQMILDRILSEYSLSNSAVDLGIGIFDSHQIAQHELSTLTWVSIEWAWEVRDARFAVVVIQGIDRLKSFWGCFSGEKVGRLPLRQLICSLGLDIHSPERHSRRSDAHHLKEMVINHTYLMLSHRRLIPFYTTVPPDIPTIPQSQWFLSCQCKSSLLYHHLGWDNPSSKSSGTNGEGRQITWFATGPGDRQVHPAIGTASPASVSDVRASHTEFNPEWIVTPIPECGGTHSWWPSISQFCILHRYIQLSQTRATVHRGLLTVLRQYGRSCCRCETIFTPTH